LLIEKLLGQRVEQQNLVVVVAVLEQTFAGCFLVELADPEIPSEAD